MMHVFNIHDVCISATDGVLILKPCIWKKVLDIAFEKPTKAWKIQPRRVNVFYSNTYWERRFIFQAELFCILCCIQWCFNSTEILPKYNWRKSTLASSASCESPRKTSCNCAYTNCNLATPINKMKVTLFEIQTFPTILFLFAKSCLSFRLGL